MYGAAGLQAEHLQASMVDASEEMTFLGCIPAPRAITFSLESIYQFDQKRQTAAKYNIEHMDIELQQNHVDSHNTHFPKPMIQTFTHLSSHRQGTILEKTLCGEVTDLTSSH